MSLGLGSVLEKMHYSNAGCPYLTSIYTWVIICPWRLVATPQTYITYGAVNAVPIILDNVQGSCVLPYDNLP